MQVELIALTVAHGLSFLFICVCTWKVFEFTADRVKSSRNNKNNNKSPKKRAGRMSNVPSLCQLMCDSNASYNAQLLRALLLTLAATSLVHLVCAPLLKPNEENSMLLIRAILMLFISMPYELLFIVYYERLRLTFHNTQYRLSDRFTPFVYAFMIFKFCKGAAVLGASSPNAKTYKSLRIVSLIAFTFGGITYNLGTMAMIIAFHYFTMKVANNVRLATKSNGGSDTGVDSSLSKQAGDQLIHTAMRVTVSGTVCLGTGVISSALIMAVIWHEKSYLKMNDLSICHYLWLAVDLSANAFSSVCVLKEGEGIYMQVFGWFHRRVFEWFTQSRFYEIPHKIQAASVTLEEN